jgi:hypothetical protein
MRRVMALWLSVALATLVGGLAVAQETAPADTPATTAPSDSAAPAESPAPAGGEEVITSSTSAAVAQADQEMDAGTYATRLRDLEQRIDALKEQIFRSKARLVKVQYALDGARIFNKADEEGPLGDQTEFEVYNGSIVPGDHNITVNLEYRGNGYGIFSYLKGYRFRVRSSYTFNAPEGKGVTIRVVAYEKGGPTAPLEERPAVRYTERTEGRAARSDGSGEEAAAGGESGE